MPRRSQDMCYLSDPELIVDICARFDFPIYRRSTITMAAEYMNVEILDVVADTSSYAHVYDLSRGNTGYMIIAIRPAGKQIKCFIHYIAEVMGSIYSPIKLIDIGDLPEDAKWADILACKPF